MNILVLNYEFPPIGGGAGDVSKALAHEYAAKGHKVRVITSRFRGLARSEEIDGYTIYRVRSFRRYPDKSNYLQMFCYIIGALPLMMCLCRCCCPDVIHVHFLVPTGLLAYLAKIFFGIPYVVTFHGGDVPSAGLTHIHTLIKPVTNIIAHQSAFLVSISKDTEALIRQDFGCVSNNIMTIDNGVDLPENSKVRKFSVPTFLFVGRLTDQKNVSFLIESLIGIRGEFRLILLGDGPDRGKVHSLIERHGLQSQVDFRGWVSRDEVFDCMRRSHFLVMPSIYEGMPMVGLQAYSFGLPIIGTRVLGLQNFIDEGRSGFLVTLNDLDMMRNTLERIIAEPVLSVAMAQYCRDLAAKRYSWEQKAAQYLAIFDNLS